MKKSTLLIFVVLFAMIFNMPVFAQDAATDLSSEEDWTYYYDVLDRCETIFDSYQADFDSFASGETSTSTQKWKNFREDIRWEAAVTCGYIMSVTEPEELVDYVDELVYGSYYQLSAVELLIQSINNNNDATLLELSNQMKNAATELLGRIDD